ncbi:MAG TPA: DUF1592 domain-containing protein [Kofleriaceae bacterium]|nr:DUF1592 domain-containing protein [Kofleriaceae bacterium]
MRAHLWAVAALCAACGSSEQRGDPGRVTLHRLNNAEYNNTVRDLLGTSLRPADEFPTDDRAYGFDTVADVLRVSTLGMELYETAAVNLITETLASGIGATSQQFEIAGSTTSGQPLNNGWLFFSAGTANVEYTAPAAGSYRISVRAYEQAAGPDPALLSIEVVGQQPQLIPVTALAAAPAVYTADVTLAAGPQQIVVGFANDFYDPASMADRNLWVDHVIVEGPLGGPTGGDSRRGRILTCADLDSADCQAQILSGFAKRAWRRPTTTAEIDRLRAIVADAVSRGDSAETGIRLALQAVLVSPHFLYRVEVDPTPDSRTPHPVTSWELASRLSYFLWSSMPDDELFALAESDTLRDPAELERQVRRMLDDPKAVALIDNFAEQWLFTRALGSQDPDYTLFPEYDDELEAAMRAETRRYFEAFLREDIPMTEFLTADFTYVNDRLADFYGLPRPGVTGTDNLVRVSLADTPRRGFLMQGSFLRVTSRPKRTSPVLRGKWVLDNLLCAPPPPPPPGVGDLGDGQMTTGSLRQQLEAHLTNPVCASCHTVMDPIGFGLDQFDAIGKYRTEDGGYAIDATGSLFGQIPFNDGRGLAAALAEQPNVYRCIVEKLYTYSGRPPIRIDAVEHIEDLTRAFEASNYSFKELVVAMATHPSFTSRRGEP